MKVLVIGGRGYVGEALRRVMKFDTFDRGEGGAGHYQGSIGDYVTLREAIREHDVVVNLVGLSPLRTPKHGYKAVHVDGVRNIVAACEDAGVKHFIQMSVIGANPRGVTSFLRSRGLGEEIVKKSKLKYTILKSNLIFDRGNELVEACVSAAPTRMFPAIDARVQPIYRGDVAKVIKRVVEGKTTGKVIELAGVEHMSIFEFAEHIYAGLGYSCKALPLGLVKSGMKVMRAMGLFGIGSDQLMSLEVDVMGKPTQDIKLVEFSSWARKL